MSSKQAILKNRVERMIDLTGEYYKSVRTVRDFDFKNWNCKDLRDYLRESYELNLIKHHNKGLSKWRKAKLISENERYDDIVIMGERWSQLWGELEEKFKLAGMDYFQIYDENLTFDKYIWEPFLTDVLEEKMFEVVKKIANDFAEKVLEKFAQKNKK